jgi:Putative transposase
MTLDADEFMRRFLLHVLPSGLHRIRHYGLLSNGSRRANLARSRELLSATFATSDICTNNEGTAPEHGGAAPKPTFVCQHCAAAMIIVQTFARWQPIRAPPQQPGAP